MFYYNRLERNCKVGGQEDECYIFGLVSVLYICRCPCWIVLYDLQREKEIAATTAISDG